MANSIDSKVSERAAGGDATPALPPMTRGEMARMTSVETERAGTLTSHELPSDAGDGSAQAEVFYDAQMSLAESQGISPRSPLMGADGSSADRRSYVDPLAAPPSAGAGTPPAPSGSASDRVSLEVSDELVDSEIAIPRHDPSAPLPPPAEMRRPGAVPDPGGPPSTGSLSITLGGADTLGNDTEASIRGTSVGSGIADVDIESGNVAPLDKRRLGITEFGAKTQRANIIDAVKTHAIMLPMVQLNPASNENVAQQMSDLRAGIDEVLSHARADTDESGNTRYTDVESGRDLTHLSEFRGRIDTTFAALSESLVELTEASDTFMEYKARQANGTSTTTDKTQRHLFGSEMHAVFARSAVQSLLVVGASAGLQVGTVAALKSYFENNPDEIPKPILNDARAALGEGASQEEVTRKAIDGFVVPGSTYLDENTSSESAIYAAEAGVGGFRGVVVPMADSINESDARAAKVQSSISKAETPEPPKRAKERAVDAMSNAWRAQVKANLVSGSIAAGISTATAGQTTGSSVLIEVAKTLGFSTFSALNNVAADGIRKAVYTGDNEAVSQGIKAGARVTGRAVSQAMKTGVSYAQSAAQGSVASRSLKGDVIKASIQAFASGGIKEGSGSIFQNMTANQLPPNEVAALKAGQSVGTIAEFVRDLNSLERPADLSEETQITLQDLNHEVSSALTNVMEANKVTFESVDFDANHRVYVTQLNQVIRNAEAT